MSQLPQEAHAVRQRDAVVEAAFDVEPMVWWNLEYGPERDFAPVAHVADYAMALAVNADIPARNLSEFVAWAKASPGRANYGLSAAGSLPHLFGVIVGQATGMSWVAVPHRGLAPLEVDLVGGQIAAAVEALSNLIELHQFPNPD